jgi:beta-lactamase regulating signal transducer with metallopeptidase domain
MVAPGSASAPAPARLSPSAVTLLLWGAGALLIVGQLLVGAFAIRRVVRRAERLEGPEWHAPLDELAGRLAITRAPTLLMASALPMPFACGVVRSSIVLPRRAAEWDERRRRAVLCHELAHVRRSDVLMNAVAQLAAAVYWFHPLAWMALRRLRIESERACDDLVLHTGTRPSEYADHLLQIVSAARRHATPAVALPLAHPREFEGRVLAILARGLRRDAPSRLRAGTLAVLGLTLIVPLAALVPVRAPAPLPAPTRQAVNVPPARPPAAAPVRTPVAAPRPAVRPTSPAGPARRDTGQGSDVVASLVHALHDPVPDVRKNAAYSLGQLQSPAAVADLGRALQRDPDPDVREMAGWALGQIQDPGAIGALGAALAADTVPEVRLIATWALGQIGKDEGVDALAAALHDRDAQVRERAAWALGNVQPRTAPATLVQALRDPAPEVRSEAAWALGQIGDRSAADALGQAFHDADAGVRKGVIWALGQIGGDAAQSTLVQALQDPDPALRAQAARALGGNSGSPWPQPMPIVR